MGRSSAIIDRIRESPVTLLEESAMGRRWLLLTAALFAGCTQAPNVAVQHEQPKQVSTEFNKLKSILGGIAGPREIVLYEGLPSDFWEPQLRDREVTQKRTIGLHGYRFYDEPLSLRASDPERFTALLSNERSFRRYRSSKRCGGYHPDYCIEWKKGDAATRALICLECAEVKFFGPQAELYCDLNPEASQALAQWLGSYRKNRPVAESQVSERGRLSQRDRETKT
jgi:hypothetical protein